MSWGTNQTNQTSWMFPRQKVATEPSQCRDLDPAPANHYLELATRPTNSRSQSIAVEALKTYLTASIDAGNNRATIKHPLDAQIRMAKSVRHDALVPLPGTLSSERCVSRPPTAGFALLPDRKST